MTTTRGGMGVKMLKSYNLNHIFELKFKKYIHLPTNYMKLTFLRFYKKNSTKRKFWLTVNNLVLIFLSES